MDDRPTDREELEIPGGVWCRREVRSWRDRRRRSHAGIPNWQDLLQSQEEGEACKHDSVWPGLQLEEERSVFAFHGVNQGGKKKGKQQQEYRQISAVHPQLLRSSLYK